MGSFRSIVIGPPDELRSLTDNVQRYISRKDTVKNTIWYETLSITTAHDVLSLEAFFDGYPYLDHFRRGNLRTYLDDLEQEGYNRIAGKGIWFVAYNYSPKQVIEERRPDTIQYIIEEDGGKAYTPFSYDPNQEFKTELPSLSLGNRQ